MGPLLRAVLNARVILPDPPSLSGTIGGKNSIPGRLARPEGIEPPTLGLEVGTGVYSGRNVGAEMALPIEFLSQPSLGQNISSHIFHEANRHPPILHPVATRKAISFGALFGPNSRAHRATRVVCPRGTHFVLPDEVVTCHSVRVEFESTTQRRVSDCRTGYRRSGTAPGRAVTALPAASRPVRLYSRCRRDRGVTGQGAGNALSKVCDRVRRGKRAPRGLA